MTVNPRNGCYAFAWAFKIRKEQAKREGYDGCLKMPGPQSP